MKRTTKLGQIMPLLAIIVTAANILSVQGCRPQAHLPGKSESNGPAVIRPESLQAQSAAEGGSSSGGALVVTDERNPWFIQNTKSVSYCIEIDEGHFQLPKARAAQLIRLAIDNWESELRVGRGWKFGGPGDDKYEIQVGTQKFIQTDCDQKVDLKFQLGFLTEEQRSQTKDISKTVGFAKRTHYDHEKLRGSGYIYISGDSGDNRYQSSDLIEQPWTMGKGIYFFMAVAHELGHVFGIPHQNKMSSSSYLMAETFMEMMLNKKYQSVIEKIKWENNNNNGFEMLVSSWKESEPKFSIANLGDSPTGPVEHPIGVFFGIDKTLSKYQVMYVLTKEQELLVSMGPDRDHLKLIGKSRLNDWSYVDSSFPHPGIGRGAYEGTTPIVEVWLPDEQQIFPGVDLKKQRIVSTALRVDLLNFQGQYLSLDGRTKHMIYVRIPFGGSPRITGVMNNEIITLY